VDDDEDVLAFENFLNTFDGFDHYEYGGEEDPVSFYNRNRIDNGILIPIPNNPPMDYPMLIKKMNEMIEANNLVGTKIMNIENKIKIIDDRIKILYKEIKKYGMSVELLD